MSYHDEDELLELEWEMDECTAFSSVIVFAMNADEEISEEEALEAFITLNGMNLFQDYSDDDMAAIFEDVSELLEEQSAEELFNSVTEVLSPEMRETAFAVATDIILADGVLTPPEKNYLSDLAQKLEIPKQTAQNIMDVMVIKNRG
ncbi:tellurite resistance TerB family protein [Kamptonema formosum]|uniref:tellurite resistance TerB family protein n=1 Tax=Kamptonema formosum TaxID=331992 RepID=UPI00034DE001|nr:tellurite resistance TerB family protein [Oscillatoria sp. PCC 10802]